MILFRGRWASITSISGPLGACSFGLLKVCRLSSFKSPKEHAPKRPLMLVMLTLRGRWASITSISGPLGACSFGLLKVCRLGSFKSPKEHAPRGPLMLVMLAHLPRNNPLMIDDTIMLAYLGLQPCVLLGCRYIARALVWPPAIRKPASTLVRPPAIRKPASTLVRPPADRKQATTLVRPFENRPQHWSPHSKTGLNIDPPRSKTGLNIGPPD